MTLGSLFDGIGGFPFSAQKHDITSIWASEIEPAPVNITKKQFPTMKHLGNIINISGADIEPVDIITFGSPCQDLSIAGKQAGLDGDRSGLFKEAIRIIKEMREATNGRYPAYAVWENVPGAFSSHKGEDFRRVLEALAESEIPIPKSGKWGGSGLVRVSDREISWRTLDAQYWGVPQRRSRIYIVCHFGSECTEEILFKCESLLGYTPQSREEREAATAAVGGCAAKTSRRSGIPPELSNVFEMTHADEVIRKTDEGVCPTLQARMGTGGNQIPLVVDAPTYCIAGNIVDRSDTAGANGIGVKEGCSYTLNTVDRCTVAYANGNGQADNSGLHDLVGALNCMHDQQAVIYAIDRAAFNQGENAKYDFDINDSGIASTLVARGPSAVCNAVPLDNVASTLRAGAGAPKHEQDVLGRLCLQRIMDTIWRWIVRRLTPRECERLQGFPDDWTRYGADGKEIKDAPRYKALGNSIAIPCAERVFKGIIKFERTKNEQNSNNLST